MISGEEFAIGFLNWLYANQSEMTEHQAEQFDVWNHDEFVRKFPDEFDRAQRVITYIGMQVLEGTDVYNYKAACQQVAMLTSEIGTAGDGEHICGR